MRWLAGRREGEVTAIVLKCTLVYFLSYQYWCWLLVPDSWFLIPGTYVFVAGRKERILQTNNIEPLYTQYIIYNIHSIIFFIFLGSWRNQCVTTRRARFYTVQKLYLLVKNTTFYSYGIEKYQKYTAVILSKNTKIYSVKNIKNIFQCIFHQIPSMLNICFRSDHASGRKAVL